MNALCKACHGLALNSPKPIPSQFQLRPGLQPFTTSATHLAAPPQKGSPNRHAVTARRQAKAKIKSKRKKYSVYQMPDLKKLTQYSLIDAMQYIRAYEVGRSASSPKYDLAIRLKTKKDGPILRNQIRLPHAVKTDIRVCVLCPADSKQGKTAKEAGATLVGEDEVFDIIKNGKIDFDRCITTPETLPKVMKAGLPRVLGPRGLMPSVKLGTVTENVAQSVKNMLGGSTYRERQGVIRMAVGQLGFTPEQLRDNVQAFIMQIRKEGFQLYEAQGWQKELFEVVRIPVTPE